MRNLFIVSKGEVSLVYLVFWNIDEKQEALQIMQRLHANSLVPANTQLFGLPSSVKLTTKKGQWHAFLATLPPGEEEEIASTIVRLLEKILKVSLERQPDMSPKQAAMYTKTIMRLL